jgi:hypothetical protein
MVVVGAAGVGEVVEVGVLEEAGDDVVGGAVVEGAVVVARTLDNGIGALAVTTTFQVPHVSVTSLPWT